MAGHDPVGRGASGVRGQAIVEFALVVPLLAVVLCAILEFGSMYRGLAAVNNASWAGARVAAAGGANDQVSAAVNSSRGSFGAVSTAISVTTSADASVENTDRTTGNYVTVTVSVPYRSMTKMIDFTVLAGITRYSSSSTLLVKF